MKALCLFFMAGFLGLVFFGATGTVHAAPEAGESGGVMHFGIIFAMFALILVAGKLGNFIERFGQPAVVGELTMGIVLAGLGFLGWGFIGEVAGSQIIAFLAGFGALLLIFSIGLESNLTEMRAVGTRAILVALIGAALPFVLGTYVVAPIFFPDASMAAHLFVGAAMVATSMGITASVFRSLGITKTRAARTFLGATVIDDVLGLVLLAIVSAIAIGGSITATSVAGTAMQSFGFLIGAIILGRVCAKPLSRALGKVYSGIGMKLSFAVSFMLLFAFMAEMFGLEPIIGAFAAGLILDQVHFKGFADPEVIADIKSLPFKRRKDREMMVNLINKHRKMHVEDLIHKVGLMFIPVFFVFTGMQVNFASLLQPQLYLTAIAITLVAIGTKMAAGLAAKGSLREKLLVGTAMVPRGEVGLIFAATGQALGVLSAEMFSTIVLVVVLTTFAAPPLIKRLAMQLHPEKIAREEGQKQARPQHQPGTVSV